MTDYGQATLKMVAELMDEGAHHLSLLMRHSARTYDPDLPELENLLTDEGRSLAHDFGRALPRDATLRGYTSPVRRCVETVEMIL